MKLKKLWFVPVIALGLVLTACGNQKKQAEPVLNKDQVIKKTQQTFKSGQVIQSVTLKTDTSSQSVIANTTFGGQNSTVFHVKNTSSSSGKTRSSEEWVSPSQVYLNGSSVWYYTDLEKLSGHSYADLLSSILNNKIIFQPNSSLTKSYKMTRDGQTYTLKTTSTDSEMMKTAASQVLNTVGESSNQKELFGRMLKYGKFTDMTVKMVVKNKKLYSCNIFVNMKLGKQMTAKIGQSYGNIGNQDFLKLPDEVLNAKPLPTVKQNKKK